jgi:hypothetical protein
MNSRKSEAEHGRQRKAAREERPRVPMKVTRCARDRRQDTPQIEEAEDPRPSTGGRKSDQVAKLATRFTKATAKATAAREAIILSPETLVSPSS